MNRNTQQLTRDLATQLLKNSDKICTAESCTGGLIAKTFTDLAGSSLWFDRGFVTYSNQAKIDMLGVNPESLEKQGAVSEAVATEMVIGALKHSEAQIAISVTGIAGPDGGSELKPVGTVWFGFALKDRVWTEKHCFDGDRDQIRNSSLYYALTRINDLIVGSI